MEEKYIELLLEKCIDKQSKILFIHYQKEIDNFIQKLIKKAKDKGILEIYLDCEDIYKTHDLLKESTEKSILESKYFDSSIWDEYAKKNASFLIMETEYPNLMEDIPDNLIALAAKRKRETRPIYRKMVEKCTLSWCIAAYPGKEWAKSVFNNEENSEEKLKQAIFTTCMLDKENPLDCWDNHLNKIQKLMNVLNQLNLTKLHYQNSLGTSLDVYLPKNYQFSSAKDQKVIVNMPSYEVFASPDYRKTEGIVYNAKPLYYNGKKVDEFWIKFVEGRAVDYDAKVGKEILKAIIEGDNTSCYLGECALVEYNSPISNLNITFGTTLIDENASCHLALGAGFAECLKDGLNASEEELAKQGINFSKIHVDFMIGTSDLSIIATTDQNKEVVIFENGNFSKEIIEKANQC